MMIVLNFKIAWKNKLRSKRGVLFLIIILKTSYWKKKKSDPRAKGINQGNTYKGIVFTWFFARTCWVLAVALSEAKRPI